LAVSKVNINQNAQKQKYNLKTHQNTIKVQPLIKSTANLNPRLSRIVKKKIRGKRFWWQ